MAHNPVHTIHKDKYVFLHPASLSSPVLSDVNHPSLHLWQRSEGMKLTSHLLTFNSQLLFSANDKKVTLAQRQAPSWKAQDSCVWCP